VSQPFQVHESSDSQLSSARRPIVLARIPHVGVQPGAVVRSAPVAPAAPTIDPESQPDLLSQGTKFYVDQQHTLAPPTEPEFHELTEPQSGPETEPRQLRFHGAHGRRRSPELSSETMPSDSPQPTVAGGLSRLHGEVTSNSGLIVTVALAASGLLLYWMLIVPARVPIADYKNSYETFGSVETEAPRFVPQTAPTAETTADAAGDQLHLPKQLPPPSDELPRFDDASAQAYPATSHPHPWSVARATRENFRAARTSGVGTKPEMAQHEMPATPIPARRQQ
jgi:hypothetical protein